MTSNFYRGTDADVVAGSANFAALLATGFASYGITSGQQAAFAALNATLQSSLLGGRVAQHPARPARSGERTPRSGTCRASAILLAKIIYATATVTDSQLVELGLLPRSAAHARRRRRIRRR